jgi:ribulose-5-phosphate 4-epimerase/fuculose-1-phosphate aldolase
MQDDSDIIRELVLASHILVNQGVLDGFGHITARSRANPERYYMPRAMAPGRVTEADIVQLDLESRPIDKNAPRTNGERFIHGEIYKQRPDVNCVLHSHSPAILPFSLSRELHLRPVVNLSGFLTDPVPLFEFRDVTERDPELKGKLQANHPKIGAAIGRELGQASVILLRGHGNVVVGQTVRWCVYRAIYTDINARAQIQAHAMGAPIIAMDEAELGMHTTECFDVDRPWDYWSGLLR